MECRLGFWHKYVLADGFVPEGLNENRQGLKPLFWKKRWRAVRYAAIRRVPDGTRNGGEGGEAGAEAPAYSRPVPLGRENRTR